MVNRSVTPGGAGRKEPEGQSRRVTYELEGEERNRMEGRHGL